jgi:hypothetical protein
VRTILSVDPGTSSGWCIVKSDAPTVLSAYGQMGPYELTDWLHIALAACDEVVIEHFRVGQRTAIAAKDIGDTLDIEGWVKLEAKRRRLPVTMQSPADAKTFSTDDKLKHLGWWSLGQLRNNRDVRSACRHMLKYLVDKNLLTAQDLM